MEINDKKYSDQILKIEDKYTPLLKNRDLIITQGESLKSHYDYINKNIDNIRDMHYKN